MLRLETIDNLLIQNLGLSINFYLIGRKMRKHLLIASLVTSLFFNIADANASKNKDEDINTYELLNLFGEVLERTKLSYVEEVTDKKLIESAINGMLTSLDPHSSYLDADSFNYMSEQTKGKFGGIGIEITMDNGLVKIVSPIDDTPAAKAGLKAGDYITHIDEETVVGDALAEDLPVRGLRSQHDLERGFFFGTG